MRSMRGLSRASKDRGVDVDATDDGVGLRLAEAVLLDEAHRGLTRAVTGKVDAAGGRSVERSERGLSHRRLVRLVVRRLRVEAPACFFKQPHHASRRALGDVSDLLRRRLFELVELECRPRLSRTPHQRRANEDVRLIARPNRTCE